MLNRMNKVLLWVVFCGCCYPALVAATAVADVSEQQITDLIGAMTLAEKVAQLNDDAPAIPRLGVPKYHWWNEALHGVGRAGLATVFPQAIGLAATWNTALLGQVGTVIGDEARAKHHQALREGRRDQYYGLTFWSPNVNIFRDPRWGRGQETYGEDPFLTSRYAVAFIGGLQGSDPQYLKVAATVKHFAVHSGPETGRLAFDARVSKRDMADTYLPAFKAAVQEAHVEGVMCSYNSINGVPSCAGGQMLGDLLRGEWGFKGHVVADCGAVGNIYSQHHYADDPTQAAVLALKAGTDLDCGSRTYLNLEQAVHNGLINESAIDRALLRLFTTRAKLGMMDESSMHPYTQIPYSVVDSAAHRQLARQAARESLVMLKNNGILPLSNNLRKVAVIGPNAHDRAVLLGNYNGTPSYYVTPYEGVKAALPNAEVSYAPGIGGMSPTIAATYLTTPAGEPGLQGEYFSNPNLQGKPVLLRVDAGVDFVWDNAAPDPQLPRERFSVRWRGFLTAPQDSSVEMGASSDDGVRLYINDQLVIDDWRDHAPVDHSVRLDLKAGMKYSVRLEYYQNTGGAAVRLFWRRGNDNSLKEAVDLVKEADLGIVVLGLTKGQEDEDVDRNNIDLAADQQQLLEQATATGKPIVLVLVSGSALAINWANEHVDATLQAWYPGQEAGHALADVLFGDYNPSGRLPITFYQKNSDLPAIDNYAMKGRTYRYFAGPVLYPFGYGLSYTQFQYSDLQFSAHSLKATDSLQIKVKIKNTGTRAGDEVAQLYLKKMTSAYPVALQSLGAFQKIHLETGEEKMLEFRLKPADFLVINNDGMPIFEPGTFTITIGPHAPAAGQTFVASANFVTDTVVTESSN